MSAPHRGPETIDGLVVAADGGDQRKRIIELSIKGHAVLIPRLKPQIADVEPVARHILREPVESESGGGDAGEANQERHRPADSARCRSKTSSGGSVIGKLTQIFYCSQEALGGTASPVASLACSARRARYSASLVLKKAKRSGVSLEAAPE